MRWQSHRKEGRKEAGSLSVHRGGLPWRVPGSTAASDGSHRGTFTVLIITSSLLTSMTPRLGILHTYLLCSDSVITPSLLIGLVVLVLTIIK